MKKRIILDENLSGKLADILRSCFKEVDVASLKQLGYAGKPDIEWMAELSNMHPKPVIITCDINISKKKLEYEALKSSGLTYVIFTNSWNLLKFDEQVWRLVRYWEQIYSAIQIPDDKGYRIFEVDIMGFSIKEIRTR